jgi:hypothetical protein
MDGYDDIFAVDNSNFNVYYGGILWPTASSLSKSGVLSPTDIAIAIPKGAGKGLAGTFLTEPIPIPTGKRLDILHLDADVPEDTEVSITVLDTSQRPISGYEKVPGPDLDLSSIENWPVIYVKVHLWTDSNRSTPVLHGLLVNWMDEFIWRDQYYGDVKIDSYLGLDVIDDQLKGSTDAQGTADLVFANMRHNTGYNMDSLGFVDTGGPDYASIDPVAFRTKGAMAVDAHDVDGDGIKDMIFASYGKGTGTFVGDSPLFLGSPTGWYEAPHHTFDTLGAMDVVMTDLNEDGYADVVFAQEQDWKGVNVTSTLFWGSAKGWNATADVEFTTTGASGVEAVDVDDDGMVDLVFACYQDSDMVTDSLVFLQESAGFCGTSPDHYLVTVGARAVASGDLDRDGNLDLVFANYDDGVTFDVDSYIYWGQASGGFGSTPSELTTVGAMDVEVADLDRDGYLDIVFANNRNGTKGYLSESYVYLNDGSGGFGPSPSVRLPTDGASAVEVADLDGTGYRDLIFACRNNDTGFRIPSVVYLGGTGGWPNSPDILLPTVGATDCLVTLLSDPDKGGYLSKAITPDRDDNIGTFNTLRYDATLDASHSATLRLVNETSGEVLFEHQMMSGPQELDLRGAFSYKQHPSIRILITVEGLGGQGGFVVDDLWINWTKRVPRPPEVLEAYLTNTTCYRTNTVQVWVDTSDEFDLPMDLKVLVQHQLVGETEWSTSMRGTSQFSEDLWRVDITPNQFAALGEYTFRVTVQDSDRMDSDVFILGETLEVLPNLPGPPVLLNATSGDSSVELRWRVPIDQGDLPVEGYWLHRGVSEGSMAMLVDVDSFTTTYIDEGLENGKTYYYAVHTFNELGESLLSNVMNATPAGLPGIPENLAGESGDGSVTLTWEPPLTDGGKPILSYYVYRSVGGGPMEWLIDVAGLSFEDASLLNGETFSYQVSAYNILGEGPMTEIVIVVPLGIANAPGDVATVAGLKSLSLSWVAPLETGGGSILGYRIYKGEDPGDLEFLVEVGSHIDYFADADVVVGTTYYYAVATMTNAGEGTMSAPVPGVPQGVPGAPKDLVAEAGDGHVVLTWSAPEDDGSSPIIGYILLQGFSSDSLSELADLDDVATYTDLSVTNDQTYWYAVIAVNAMGEGVPTDAVEVTPFKPPTAPGKVLSLEVKAKGDKVVLGWISPSDNGGSAVTGYLILRGESPDAMEVIAEVGLIISYTDGTVGRGRTYYYSVVALNIVGEGVEHQPAMVKVPKKTEAGLPILPIAGAIAALVGIVLVAMLALRGRGGPTEPEEVEEEEAEEGTSEEGEEEVVGYEAAPEEAAPEETAPEEETPEGETVEGGGIEEVSESHPEIVIEHRGIK